MNTEIILKRLAIIKYIFYQGVEQTSKPETISGLAILNFHDSVEMFLKLYSEYKDQDESFEFHKYWNKFQELPQKEQMKSLSIRRKNIKHKGIFPSKLDIEHSKFSTKEFFEEATPLINGIEFSKISLTELVTNKKVRESLKNAEISASKKDYIEVLKHTASAFQILITEYEEKAQGDYISPFYFGENLSFHNSFFMGLDNYELPKEFKKLGEFVDKVGKTLEQIQFAIKIISLGIDYRKYVKFKYLTPIATIMRNGDIICEMMPHKQKESYTAEELEFLIHFVIESALKLQEFEIDYENLNFKNQKFVS